MAGKVLRSLYAVVAVSVSTLLFSTASAAERHGGIEIGAKGVKVSAIEIDGFGDEAALRVLSLEKKTVDVTISRLKGKNFSEVKIEDVAAIVKDFQTALKDELQIPVENIRVVASSGVPFAENFGDLVTAIQEQAGQELSKIDAREEATLTNLALVPKEWRTETLVLDIGSGNSKGGIFLTDAGSTDGFVVIEVPYGTATLSKAIDDEVKTNGNPRFAAAQVTSSHLVGQPLRQQLSDTPELSQRRNVLFSGGSVWAAMTIMRPESALDPFPRVRVADLKAYRVLLEKTPGKYPEIDFSHIADPAAQKAAQTDYDRIRGASGAKAIFTPEELQAGAAILNEVADALGFHSKSVYFDRKAVTAWITAFITPEELRAKLPAALGRQLPEPSTEPEPAGSIGRFGGIEIGAKGIKVSAVQVEETDAGTTLKVLSLDKKTVDVTISRLKGKNFSDVKIDDVAEIVKEFQSALHSELMVPAANTKVVASSGVPFADNFADLVSAIQQQTGLELSKINAREEASLTNLALVPKEWRTRALVIDIGSGNTKGGLFLDDTGTADQFAAFEVPYGTATLSKALDEKAKADSQPRDKVLPTFVKNEVGDSLREQISSQPELKNRKHVFFSGGSVWAAVTIISPDQALNPFPVIRAADLKTYSELLAKNPGKYPAIDFSKIADPEIRKAAQADYDRISGAGGSKAVFSPEELQAGAALLSEISNVMDFKSKVVYFDRKAVTAWITAFITPEAIRDRLPAALGRTLPDLDAAIAGDVASGKNAPVQVTDPLPTPSQAIKSVPHSVPADPKTRLIPPVPINNLEPPKGLSKSAVELLIELHFIRAEEGGDGIVYSASFCREVGIKCYECGRYQDALAFSKQSLALRNDAACLYLKALSELALNRSDDAQQTAGLLQQAGGSSVEIIGPLRERLNGPRAVRLVRMINNQ